jgi:hypothetical protein
MAEGKQSKGRLRRWLDKRRDAHGAGPRWPTARRRRADGTRERQPPRQRGIRRSGTTEGRHRRECPSAGDSPEPRPYRTEAARGAVRRAMRHWSLDALEDRSRCGATVLLRRDAGLKHRCLALGLIR